MKQIILLLAFVLFITTACSPIAKNTVRKKIGDTQSLGVDEFNKGNYSTAKVYFESALQDAYSVDSSEDQVFILQSLTEIALKFNDINAASNAVFTAKNIVEREKLATAAFTLNLSLGKYYDKTGEYDKALSYYQKAFTAAQKDEDKAIVYQNIGITKFRMNNTADAAVSIENSRKINDSRKLNGPLADNYFFLGEIESGKSNWDGALSNYILALQNDRLAERPFSIMDDLRKTASVYLKKGDTDNAIYYYRRALNTAKSLQSADDVKAIQAALDSIGK